jgi:hypothetical protein
MQAAKKYRVSRHEVLRKRKSAHCLSEGLNTYEMPAEDTDLHPKRVLVPLDLPTIPFLGAEQRIVPSRTSER